jgi:hypothetical protein
MTAPIAGPDGTEHGARPSTRTSLGHALGVGVAGLLANGLNLIVTIVLARVLPSHDHNAAYGAFAQMVGIFIVVSLPGSAVAITVVRRSSWWLARGGHLELEAWRRRTTVVAVRALAVFALVALAASPLVGAALGGRSWVAVFLTSLAAGCWVGIAVERAFLQSCRRYQPLAVNLLLEGGVRTAAVMGGGIAFGVTGAVAGILVCEVVTWAHAWWAAKAAVPNAERSAPGEPPRGELGIDLVASVVAFAMLAFLQYVDVFLVGRLNQPGVGRYATIAVVAKTVVYVAIVLSYYLLPEASLGHRAGGQARRPLALVVGLYAVPCVLLEGVAIVAPHRLLALVFPAHLLGAAGSLKILTLAMACLGLSFLLATYQLARGVRLAAVWLLLGAVASVFVVATGHGHWRGTTVGDLAAQAVIAAGLVIGTLMVLVRRRTT